MTPGYTEPKSLVERPELLKSRKHILTLFAVLIVLALGIWAGIQLGGLEPTFNGDVDVTALQEDSSDYDLDDADGAAYVIVSENLDKTNAKNVCFSVVFNFRGFDTMGESFILITALAGALCILRIPKTIEKRKEKELAAPAKGEEVQSDERAE